MKQLTFATKEDALARSRAEWEKHLGRPRRREDVTEFLWAVSEDAEGKAVVLVPDADISRLSLKERTATKEFSALVSEDGTDDAAIAEARTS